MGGDDPTGAVPGADSVSAGAFTYVAGARVEGRGDPATLSDPASGEVLARFRLAAPVDVDDAVASARAAFAEWAAAAPGERAEVMTRWARLLSERADDLAIAETRQCGKPIRLATGFDVPGSIDNVSFFAGVCRNLEGKAAGEYSPGHTSMVRREPVGVVGSIAPWNYPLQMAAWKVLPAVAAGNAVVLKPSELTPLTTLLFAEAATEAGLPPGVLNVVTGTGGEVGEHLVAHPDVDMVSFTGSSAVGRRVMAVAAQTPKRVQLELGGKAPFVVFDDADLEAAARGAVAGSLINTGQDCTAATRAYVQRPLYDAFVERVGELLSHVRLGDPRDPATDMGSLISRQQQGRVRAHVDGARGRGARIVVGGRVPQGDLAAGAYYEPTLIIGVEQTDPIVREEVFGPVLVVLPFDSDDDGLALANDSRYGLAASVWSRDVHRCFRATRTLSAGTVWVNDHIPIISEMPHGGVKSSGFGKDMSTYSLEEYTVVKHVMFEGTGEAHKDWHDIVFRGS